VRNGLSADAAVILEPTDLQVAHLVRGAVWFEIRTTGKAGHSGSPESTRSALKTAVSVMEAVEHAREELLAVSRSVVPKVAAHPNPMPCTFGILQAGNWPAAAPAEAVMKGVFGFLPPFRRKDIQEELVQAVRPFAADIRFNMLRSEPSFLPEDHPLVRTLLEAARDTGVPSQPAFMNASCDAWRYTEQLGMPAVVFGPGSLASAHAADERIAVEDIRKAALTLVAFIQKWSGFEHA
jgi:acetylornithine deacetylase